MLKLKVQPKDLDQVQLKVKDKVKLVPTEKANQLEMPVLTVVSRLTST